MKTLALLFTLLAAQQADRPESGAIRGRLTTANGGPAAMVRIALARPDTLDAITELINISQTDAAGVYELTNVPPGRYLLVAGLVSSPTYYPGVSETELAQVVTIAPGQVSNDLSFSVLPGLSPVRGTMVSGGTGTVTGIIRVDDSTPLPTTSAQTLLLLQIGGRAAANIRNPLGTFAQQFSPGDNWVTIGPLALGYYVKSMTYGNVDLTKAPLTLPASSNATEIEIVLTKTRPENAPTGVRVTGHVTRGEDALRLNRPIELLNITTGRGVYAGAIVLAENDMFSLDHVLPGRYRIRTQPVLEFDVGPNDVAGLTFHLGKPDTAVPLNSNSRRTVQGTIEGLGDAIPPFEIAFIPARTNAAAHVVAVSSKEFSMGVPEGEYRIGISGLPDGYAVSSIIAGPLDLTSPFLLTSKGIADRFTGTAIPGGIAIRLRRQ